MEDLFELVAARDELADLDEAERRLALRSLFSSRVAPQDLAEAVATIADSIDGLGPITHLFEDDSVTDILVNGAGQVWVESDGELQRTPAFFASPAGLRNLVERVISHAGVRVDNAHPIADARLEDGSRLHVVLPPIAPQGPVVSIRCFPRRMPVLADLVAREMLTEDQAAVLRAGVEGRRSLLISGATGTGKTTLLNALLNCVPGSERIVAIEETPELRPDHPHVISLHARPPNLEGLGAVGLDQLVRAALRMRPDRIVVGEVRGPEALDALEALSTGHEGSMLTLHAHSPDDALERLVTLALSARTGPSEAALERRVLRSFHAVVQLARRDRVRRVVAIEDVE
ncbi:MAG: CpaF family protein [Actinomycetota bacterium]